MTFGIGFGKQISVSVNDLPRNTQNALGPQTELSGRFSRDLPEPLGALAGADFSVKLNGKLAMDCSFSGRGMIGFKIPQSEIASLPASIRDLMRKGSSSVGATIKIDPNGHMSIRTISGESSATRACRTIVWSSAIMMRKIMCP